MKRKTYPKYKPSGVEWLGDVPEHWEVKRLSYLATLKSGENITSEMIAEGGDCPVYGGNGLRGNYHKFTHRGHHALIGRQGALCGNINYASGEFYASEHALVVSPLKEYSVVWMGELLRAMNLGQYSVTAAQPGIAAEVIRGLRIPVPPLPEQRAIAAFLDRETGRIDALIAKKRELVERLKEKRTALISHTVTHGLPPEAAKKAGLPVNPPLKPSGVEWLNDIPKHWEVKRLKFVIKERLQYGANESSGIDDPDLPRYVRITDIDEMGKLRPETFRSLPVEIAREYFLEDGDVLFARSGATSGKTFLYRHEWGKCAYAGYLIRARLNQNKIEPQFLRHFTNSSNYWQWLSSSLIQATIQNVSAEKYADLALPLPPLSEQAAIAAYLDAETAKLDTLVAKIEEAVERLQEYRTALITAAVTGKIDVRECYQYGNSSC